MELPGLIKSLRLMICFIFVLWSWAAADCTGKSYLVSLFPLVLKGRQKYREAGSMVCGQSPSHELHSNSGENEEQESRGLGAGGASSPMCDLGTIHSLSILNLLLLKMGQLDDRTFSSFNIYARSSFCIYFLTQNPTEVS